MKNPNGFGGITKLSGNRRKPYWVRVTKGWDINEKTGKPKQIYQTVGYFATRKEAMIALAEYNINPTDLTNITFAECYEKWSPKYFEKLPKSEKNIRAAFRRCAKLHNMKMKDIKAIHLQTLMDEHSEFSTSSQMKMKAVMSKNFKWAMENDLVQKDYSQFVTIVKNDAEVDDKFFTSDDIKKVLNNLDFKHDKYALGDSVVVMLYTGVRIGELLDIKWEHIDLENRIIDLHGTKTKNAKRLVPIHKDIVPILEKRKGGEYLYEVDGKKIPYGSYKKTFFEKFMKHLGLDLTPHATRHTFISRMDACGVGADNMALKRIVGHSNSSMTEYYTHKTNEELIEVIDKFKLL